MHENIKMPSLSLVTRLSDAYNLFINKLSNNENFSLIRYEDGERSLILGKSVIAQEGWKSPGNITLLGKDIEKTLQINDPRMWLGISCPCCDYPAYYWYITRTRSKNITFSNLWININFKKFILDFPKLNRNAVFIGNYRAKELKNIGSINIIKHYSIDDNCVNFWSSKAQNMLTQIKDDFGKQNDLLYIVSAGPMAAVIIADLFKNNPNNTYVDFGSAIDYFYRNDIYRPYTDQQHSLSQQNCWQYFDRESANLKISVVLNLYKRPDNLLPQIKSLLAQSLKPDEIILFQDGTNDETLVSIPDEVKPYLNKIKISKVNQGVWARFKFALNEAANNLVCVFDDDTIPGENWLANCHFHMMLNNGLYGTIGILMINDKYPSGCNRNYVRVGWDGNLSNSVEVDFVGHSWFFKKEWLRYLFDAPQEVQDLKYAGEDISFSYELQKHGIKTFVPPHPKNRIDLFGSIPETAYALGTSKQALSMSSTSIARMNKAIKLLLSDGWTPLYTQKPSYLRSLQYCILNHKNKYKEIGYFKFIIWSIKIFILRKLSKTLNK